MYKIPSRAPNRNITADFSVSLLFFLSLLPWYIPSCIANIFITIAKTITHTALNIPFRSLHFIFIDIYFPFCYNIGTFNIDFIYIIAMKIITVNRKAMNIIIFVALNKKGVIILCTLDKIKEKLSEQKKNQTDLCEFLDLNKQAFTEWNGGRNTSFMKHLPKIAEFLNVSVDYLLGKEEKPTNDDELKSVVTDSERKILKKYNQLNDIGKNKADAYIDGLLENPSYCNYGDIYEETRLVAAPKVTPADASPEDEPIDIT